MPLQIPPPEYIGETVSGAVYDLPGGMTLLIGQTPAALASRAPLLGGILTVRYGIPLYIPPTDVVIPGLFFSEKGAALIGREAWDYMQRRFQMHPRADVVGLRMNGAPAQVFLRELDWGAAVRVFVYDSAAAHAPTAELKALVTGPEAPPLPDLLARYLPAVPLDRLLQPKEA
jgi:hypothetical protein